QLSVLSQAIANGVTNLTPYLGTVTATGGNNTFVGGVGETFTALGGANNSFVIADPSLLGLAGTTLPAQLYNYGGPSNGSGGNDSYYFVGGGNGNALGNVVLNEPAPVTGPGAPRQTLDFSSFQGGGVNLNLNNSGKPQAVTSGLTLTVPASITNVVGSPASDTLTGNNLNDTIPGAAVDNPDPYALPAVPPANPQTQWVYLDFKDYPTPPSSEVVVNFQSPGAQPTITANGASLQGT